MTRLLPSLAAFLLAGCVTASGRWITAEDADGVMRRVLHIDGVPCPTAISAAPDTAGCFYSGPVVFTGGSGESLGEAEATLEHELDHHRGGKHGPWRAVGQDKCAPVLAQGRTNWRVGNLLCRGERGYYQTTP